MYSDISIRTILRSSSNNAWATALASSVFPTPVGPKNRKEPIGRSGSWMPARERIIASATFRTASSWPITLWCSVLSRCSNFSRSPSIRRVTGMPVQRPTMRAISSSVTLSRSSVAFWVLPFSSKFASCFCSSGSLPYFNAAALSRSYSRSASSIWDPTCSISSRSFCTCPIDVFSFSQRAFISWNCSRISVSSFWISAKCSADKRLFSFFNAASSISCCIIFREISSNSAGIESISVRMVAQASSTRSMALSGKNRSVI